MKYLVGSLLITIGIAHGVHVLGVEVESIATTGSDRFLSFSSLDRLVSASLVGRLLVLIGDGVLIFLGVAELLRRHPR